jgi:hypothetical protein
MPYAVDAVPETKPELRLHHANRLVDDVGVWTAHRERLSAVQSKFA